MVVAPRTLSEGKTSAAVSRAFAHFSCPGSSAQHLGDLSPRIHLSSPGSRRLSHTGGMEGALRQPGW